MPPLPGSGPLGRTGLTSRGISVVLQLVSSLKGRGGGSADGFHQGLRQSLRLAPGAQAYFAVVAVGNLTWEALHLPLYALWTTGSRSEQVFAVVHCTGGDLLIALSSLMLSLLVAGDRGWPHRSFTPVAMLAVALGVAYTGFSEWLNLFVRRSWAYSGWMPVVPIAGGIGLSPLLQWLVVPGVGFWAVKKRISSDTPRRHSSVSMPSMVRQAPGAGQTRWARRARASSGG